MSTIPLIGEISYDTISSTFVIPKPLSASNLYRGGEYVTDISANSNIPLIGSGLSISLQSFRGATKSMIPQGSVSWATSVRGVSDDQAWGITGLNDGGMVVTGYYNNNITAFSVNGTSTSISVGSGYDNFIIKYSSAGNIVWSTRIIGPGTENNIRTAATSDGGVIVSGVFTNNLQIFNADGSSFTTYTNTVASSFAVKYNTNGVCQWATRFSNCSVFNVTKQSDGGGVVGGNFNGTATLYNANGTTYGTITSSGSGGLIIKINANGSIVWAARFTTVDDIRGIAALPDDSIVITGANSGTITAYNTDGSAFATTITNSGFNDPYLIKYNSNGTVGWLARYVATNWDSGQHVTVTSEGLIIMTSFCYSGTVSVYNANGTLFGNVTTRGSGDVVIAAYNASGNVQYTCSVGGSGDQVPYTICPTSDGGFAVAGYFNTTLVAYNANGTANTALTPNGADGFIVVYSKTGTFKWQARIGGSGTDQVFGIASLTDGSLVVCGQYASSPLTIYDGSNNAFGTTLTNSGTQDAFIIRYT